MTTRRRFVSGIGATLLAPLAARAQQPTPNLRRIGFLSQGSAAENATRMDGLRAGLRGLGYVEGKNIVIEYRWADGKAARLPELAGELVKANVEVIVTHGPPAIRAASQATSSTPIVIAAVGDVLAAGFVTSLARPGGNITGMSFFSPQLSAKRLELLKEATPRVAETAILLNPDNPVHGPAYEAVDNASKSLKIKVQPFPVRARGEFESTFAAIAKARLGTVALIEDPVFNTNFKVLAELAAKHRMASLGSPDFADVGGWIGYGVNIPDLFRRSAYFVDRIFKGARPAELPIEQPTKFELFVNTRTAKALGIKMPESILLRADKVIE